MKLIIDIPNYNLNNIQNGSIACGQILKAVKNGKPYEERPKGEWIDLNKNNIGCCDDYGNSYVKCSVCDEVNGINDSNFCPNCGADMRGKKNDK